MDRSMLQGEPLQSIKADDIVCPPIRLTNEPWATPNAKYHIARNGQRAYCGRYIKDNWNVDECAKPTCQRCLKFKAMVSC